MVDIQRFHEVRRIGYHWLVESVETNLDGAGLDAGAVEDVPEPHSRPSGVTHRAVSPLRPRHPWQEIAARIPGALIDGDQFDSWQSANKIVQR
jgi:hypothetical protein